MRFLLVLLSIITLSSCAGYRLGSAKPAHLAQVKSIAIPLFKNDTLEQRIAILATNSCIDEFTRDGTFQIASTTNADATLEATITEIKYSELRSERLDTLSPEELSILITIDWQLLDSNNKVLDRGKITGASRLFVDNNLQLARENSYPDALQVAAQKLVSRIANGF